MYNISTGKDEPNIHPLFGDLSGFSLEVSRLLRVEQAKEEFFKNELWRLGLDDSFYLNA